MSKYMIAALFFVGILAILQVEDPPPSLHPDHTNIYMPKEEKCP